MLRTALPTLLRRTSERGSRSCSSHGAARQRSLPAWLQKRFGWGAEMAQRTAESIPPATAAAFDHEKALTLMDVLKVRYRLRHKDIAALVSRHPAVLGYSLKHQVVPAINVLDKTLRLPEELRNRVVLRVPRMLSNELGDVRAELEVALQRVCHLNRTELAAVMQKLRARGEPLALAERPYRSSRRHEVELDV